MTPILHLILSRIGCFISMSENIGVSTPVPVTQSSSSVQHLGYGARDVFPFDKNDRAAIGPQRSGQVEFGRRQATFQRTVLFVRTNREYALKWEPTDWGPAGQRSDWIRPRALIRVQGDSVSFS